MQPHDGAGPFHPRHAGQIDPDKLGRAAADIHDHQLLGLGADQRRAGDHGQPRLFLGLDDVQPQPRLAPDHADEIARVGGTPARFGRDQPHMADLVLLQLRLADPQRVDRAAHGGGVQPPARLEPLAKLHGLGEGIHDMELVALGLGNQHAARVRAEIQRGIKRRGIGFLGAGRLYRFREHARTYGTLGRHFHTPSFTLTASVGPAPAPCKPSHRPRAALPRPHAFIIMLSRMTRPAAGHRCRLGLPQAA